MFHLSHFNALTICLTETQEAVREASSSIVSMNRINTGNHMLSAVCVWEWVFSLLSTYTISRVKSVSFYRERERERNWKPFYHSIINVQWILTFFFTRFTLQSDSSKSHSPEERRGEQRTSRGGPLSCVRCLCSRSSRWSLSICSNNNFAAIWEEREKKQRNRGSGSSEWADGHKWQINSTGRLPATVAMKLR